MADNNSKQHKKPKKAKKVKKAKKKSLKKKSTKSQQNKRRSKLIKSRLAIIGGLTALLILSALIYLAYLDTHIRHKFEGKRWSLPARVYARPLSLFPGADINKQDLVQELKFLNYRQGQNAPGTYKTVGNVVMLDTRGFTYWDAEEPPRALHVTFNQHGISEILDTDSGRLLKLLRLEPMQMASIYPANKEDRDLIRLQDAPAELVNTLIAVEDTDFYVHAGVKPTAILRALLANIRAGATVQGGSTLTQQLVKNFFLNNRRTLRRKITEALMSLLLEFHYSKEDILEAYLNEVYLGQDGERAIHGFALASRFYFDRPLSELNSEQIALLVGLVKGPSYYDPRRNPERARQRRDVVLEVMLAQGLLNSDEATQARLQAINVRPKNDYVGSSYPAYISLIKRQLQVDYRDADLRSEGLRIFTSFDPIVQAAAETALSQKLQQLSRSGRAEMAELQGAVVVSAVDTGEVLAMVGDRDASYAGYNRALDARRQIGSLVKPAVYLTALEHPGLYHPSALIDDSPLTVDLDNGQSWQPKNYDGQFHGFVPFYAGLTNSYNVATARLGLTVGVDKVINTLQQMGLQQRPEAYPSLLLGALELTPLEVSHLYQTLAANGFSVPLRAVRDVLTSEGSKLTRYPLSVQQTLDSSSVYLLNSMLQQVARQGTAKKLATALPHLKAAGKTGTSDDLRDSWFAGFTGQHLAVVWLGNDDNSSTGLTGASGALPVWIDLMKAVRSRPLRIPMPKNIEHVWIDKQSGLRSGPKCENAVQLPFIIGSAPSERAACKGRSVWDWLLN